MSLFSGHELGNLIALVIFIIACITDSYDGYYARKYNEETPEGKFLDPLADKVLVLSAFISFSLLGIIDYWMVGLIIFRDLFVTGLRMAIEYRGLSMVTSLIAKTKTTIQYIIIIFTLIVLGLKGIHFAWTISFVQIVNEFRLIYNLTFFITLFTVLTGLTYLYDNRNAIQEFIKQDES